YVHTPLLPSFPTRRSSDLASEAADDRQRLLLRQEPLAARAARPRGDPPPDDRALSTPHQREGRTLPPDDGQGVGLRGRLPLPSRSEEHTSELQSRGHLVCR